MDKAILICYATLEKLWPTAEFNDVVEVIVESARILSKNEMVSLGSTQRVCGQPLKR